MSETCRNKAPARRGSVSAEYRYQQVKGTSRKLLDFCRDFHSTASFEKSVYVWLSCMLWNTLMRRSSKYTIQFIKLS
ncbi:hypothetical protein EB796_007654 [Bugula neritina]|uniref:Uncharacterized protein n=1 Tax=Bugula neritina TaxID=10212 RepID=A0A7J7K5Z5_BUGNE|nr:hypothetical protein EB796_007654 [Bugula neritina]